MCLKKKKVQTRGTLTAVAAVASAVGLCPAGVLTAAGAHAVVGAVGQLVVARRWALSCTALWGPHMESVSCRCLVIMMVMMVIVMMMVTTMKAITMTTVDAQHQSSQLSRVCQNNDVEDESESADRFYCC